MNLGRPPLRINAARAQRTREKIRPGCDDTMDDEEL
jgi:hypothetical protein